MSRLLLMVIITLLAPPLYADAPDGYPFMSYDQAVKMARKESKLIFVYFGRYGCGFCEKTNKESFIDADVRQRYTDNYVLAYVDAESGKRLRLPSGERITERELGMRYKAFVTPVFTFITPGGKQILQLIGVQTIEELLKADSKVQQALASLGAS